MSMYNVMVQKVSKPERNARGWGGGGEEERHSSLQLRDKFSIVEKLFFID